MYVLSELAIYSLDVLLIERHGSLMVNSWTSGQAGQVGALAGVVAMCS